MEYVTESPYDALLRLDKPGPGIAALGAVTYPGGQSVVAMNFYLYGDQAAATVARENAGVARVAPGTLPDSDGGERERMRELKIIEHISLDGVIQHSADDGDFPYSGPRPIGPPLVGTQCSPRMASASICCLAVAPTMAGRASGQRRRSVRWRTASMRRNMS